MLPTAGFAEGTIGRADGTIGSGRAALSTANMRSHAKDTEG